MRGVGGMGVPTGGVETEAADVAARQRSLSELSGCVVCRGVWGVWGSLPAGLRQRLQTYVVCLGCRGV